MYTDYAPIYDAIGQARHNVHLAERVIGWMHAHECFPRKVLDLACGTGMTAQMFAAQGSNVTGVDCSIAMLEIAQAKARDLHQSVAFIKADMRALSEVSGLSPASFDCVSCFGALNYLIEDNDLTAVLTQVRALLKSGGVLVLSVHSANDYATWDYRDEVVYNEHDCMVYHQLCYDPASRLANRRIAWFVREIDHWWRGEETHIERAWSDAEVAQALEDAHLCVELKEAITEEHKYLYVVRKP
ncbi:MAG: class I SAM-dependent methyltransferase [Chloroflexi bacterium AL-W]|nr:class I SAM-dependent methyltransferase [Chloroflexi bacterium AL-N1]NOK65215.1 class I SAM-dependent methyltransferase [Chloroflexi bacterium AL-N10]NOK72520.1 class I SAM-dependent methyltransferase [Chloroflexi bacterium AL-N5]NOK79394.1 class I SAM-dependent methyltransferase [Chloroflexi bacterium AL-W]NOK87310.1 class I SAM-dependent methyltransferase [Chloroflexi bacterium AL-N15]